MNRSHNFYWKCMKFGKTGMCGAEMSDTILKCSACGADKPNTDPRCIPIIEKREGHVTNCKCK